MVVTSFSLVTVTGASRRKKAGMLPSSGNDKSSGFGLVSCMWLFPLDDWPQSVPIEWVSKWYENGCQGVNFVSLGTALKLDLVLMLKHFGYPYSQHTLAILAIQVKVVRIRNGIIDGSSYGRMLIWVHVTLVPQF
jgi:hypothetical protein